MGPYLFPGRQVLKQKPLDNEEVQRVSVRRFSSFNLFSRTRLTTLEPEDPSDGDWVEYRNASFPQFSALLRDNLGPIRVDEVLNSFDNTGNVSGSTAQRIGGRARESSSSGSLRPPSPWRPGHMTTAAALGLKG
ncbi:hypothetical protein SKAU_G00162190 [Synaphobranchus kaupii]|uniref:Uncharacterized protein n=1 Tax=Synaphobranchus kaupii TaxID=118154 RepID=A0A9Q1FJ58_SYNKA|nr:hypothetical protein SKAU_G00162190 [Synaphobranchus kaupii]